MRYSGGDGAGSATRASPSITTSTPTVQNRGEQDARFHWDHLFDRDGRTDSIAGPDRRPESQALRHVDASRTGQLVGDRRGDYACRQQSMGYAALENGACRELLVDVDGVVVAGHGGEQDDVGFRDGLGERGAHPDPQICKCVTSELIHRTALLDCTETRNSLLAAVKICTRMPPDLMSSRGRSPMLFFQNIASRCVLDGRVG